MRVWGLKKVVAGRLKELLGSTRFCDKKMTGLLFGPCTDEVVELNG